MHIVDEDQVIGKVTEDLTHVEDMLDDCLSSMMHYTGKGLTWTTYSMAVMMMTMITILTKIIIIIFIYIKIITVKHVKSIYMISL